MSFVVIFTFATFGLVTVAAFSHELSQSVAVGVVTELTRAKTMTIWNDRLRWKRHTRLLGAVDSGKAPKRSACHPNYCRNGGSCKLDKRQHSGFRCLCKPQFSGLRCDNGPFSEDADCLKIPCRGRGRCVHTTRGFVCQCEAGFTGDTCEDSDGTRNRDYSVAVIAVVSVVLVTFILLGVFAVVVEKERQNRIDKYYYYIRLRMNTPESTGFVPVAYSVCKNCCAKLRRLRSTKKKAKAAAQGRQTTDATSPLLPVQPTPTTGARQPFPGTVMPPRPPRLPSTQPPAPARPGAPTWGPRFRPPARFPATLTRFPRPPTMPPGPRPRV